MTVVVVGTHTSIKVMSLYVKQLNVLNFQHRLPSLHHCLRYVCTLLLTCLSDTTVRHMHRLTQRGGGVWGGGGVGTLVYSYVRRLRSFFGDSNSEFQ